MVQRFLQKSIDREHVHRIEYAAGRHIYHLKAKAVYRIIGQEDSQNRRDKSDGEIKLRLMQLDYVLDHPGCRFLDNECATVEFLHRKLGVPMSALPRRGGETVARTRYFPDRLPIAVVERSNSLLVSLAFVDAGHRSLSAFSRWLEQHDGLLRLLPHAEVVYVADTPRNFDDAEHEFARRFSKSRVTIRGHLLQYDYPLWSMKYRRAVL